jgi:hypothetical protein
MTVDVNMQAEKEKLAREWLVNLRPLLGLDKAEENKLNKKNQGEKKTTSSSKGKYADVSDDEMEEEEVKGVKTPPLGDKENAVLRHKEVFVKVGARPCVTHRPHPPIVE